MLQTIRTFRQFLNKIKHDYVNAFSAQAALFIIISAFPLLIMLLSMIQFLPITKSDFLSILIRIVPDSIVPLMINITEELYQKSSGTFLSFTAIMTLWSASRGALSIVHGLNSVYDIDETRNYVTLRVISCIYTLVFMLIIILSLLLLVFGNTLYSIISIRYPFFEKIAAIFISTRTMIVMCFLMLFFTLLYKVLPNHHAKLAHQLPGALFASSGWLAFSFCFSIYIDNFSNFSYMYGSLTAIVLLMLWLYFCMYILFLGGEINVFFEPMIARFYLKLRQKKSGR